MQRRRRAGFFERVERGALIGGRAAYLYIPRQPSTKRHVMCAAVLPE